MKRRVSLYSIAATVLLLLLSACATVHGGALSQPAFITGAAGQPLRQPASLPDLNPDPHILEVNLTAQVSTYEFLPGHPAEVWTYNGMLPGPLLELSQGDELVVHFRNELPEATTVHWHGIRLPQAMDGSHASQDPVPPGGSFEYRFTVPDAALFWYHPHFDGDMQFSRGLYGPLLVHGPEEPAFDRERVLVLSDIELDAQGQVMPADTRARNIIERSLGTTGNTLLVNGQLQPRLELRRGSRERWRILDAAAARVYKLGLPGQSFHLIGTDGGLIEAPVEMSDIVMGPGERNDIVVTAPLEGGATALASLEYAHLRFEPGYVPEPDAPLLRLSYSALPPLEPAPLPAHLADIPELPAASAERGFNLNAKIVPDMLAASQLTSADGHGGGMEEDGTEFRINGQVFPNVPTFESKLGTTELWKVNNHTGMDHPFHLHGFRFQIVSIDDTPYPYRAWKDTVNLPTTEDGAQFYHLLVDFDGYPGEWVYHCHILFHQENGMMGDFFVVP